MLKAMEMAPVLGDSSASALVEAEKNKMKERKKTDNLRESGEDGKASINEMTLGGDSLREKRREVDKLRETDNKYEDSALDIALEEDSFRELLKSTGIKSPEIDKKKINEIADKNSDGILRAIKAEKERDKANEEKWIDKLTGLRNRNAYQEEMVRMLKLEKRNGTDCSILMIDADHFKKVNDSYGHSVGDMVLKKIADTIKNSLRASDVVYRYGGEEFFVFLPNTKSPIAKKIAEKIRANIFFQIVEFIKESGERITLRNTVSVGIMGTDQLEDWRKYKDGDAKNLLKKMTEFADKAAYLSKAEGRNRVTLYSEELDEMQKTN